MSIQSIQLPSYKGCRTLALWTFAPTYLETETDTERARENEKQRESQREAIRSPNDVILSPKLPKDIVKQASRVSQNAIQNELLLGFLSFGLQF